jgi:hypothetical protein
LSDRDQLVSTVHRNLDGEHVPCDQDAVGRMLDKYFGPDFLSYRKPESDWCRTWQESYLVQCFQTSMRDGKLENYITFRGSTGEELAFLTEDALENMRQNLDDPRAHCVIDTVAYLLHGVPMQDESVALLIEQVLGRIEDVISDNQDVCKLNCTAVDLISKLLDDKKLPGQDKSKLFAGVSKTLKGSINTDAFHLLSVKGFPLSKEQKRLIAEAKASKCLAIDGIDNVADLLRYLDDVDNQLYCDEHSAEKTLEKIYGFAPNAETLLPTLFVSAMNYLIGLLDNKKIDSGWTKACLMGLQKTWNKQLYSVALENMQTFSTSMNLTQEQMNDLKEETLEHPYALARSLMPLSESGIEKVLEEFADHPFNILASKTLISSYIPCAVHYACSKNEESIDAMIFTEVDSANKKFSYRQRNHYETVQVMGPYYERATQMTRFMVGLILQAAPEMYKIISSKVAGQYVLLGYPSAGPMLGHVCQLFPVMENTIRELGACCGVAPFRLKKDKFHMLKDASQVLYGILDYVHSVTGTIAGAEDIAFVYHAMFSANGLNVRNACIHGQDYQSGPALNEAFALTVLCEYMLLHKLDLIRETQEKPEDAHDEKTSAKSEGES